jgi:hypothetical protein
MHSMLMRATGLTLRLLVKAQCSAIVCSAGLAATLLLTEVVLRKSISEPAPWELLVTEVATGGLFYAAFLLFAPLKDVRELVDETLADFAPRLAPFLKGRLGLAAPQRQNL